MIHALGLMAIHGATTIPLAEVCERYFGLSLPEAMRKAAVNELPVPAFRLTSSRKAPLVVSAQALGDWIGKQEAAATASWARSNSV